jgi:hypothetical protein
VEHIERWHAPSDIGSFIKRLFALSRVEWLMTGIVVLALLVRAYGLTFGLPMLYEPGEAGVIRPAVGMFKQSIASGSWESPEQFVQPTAYKFIQWAGTAVTFYVGAYQSIWWNEPDNIPVADLWRFYPLGRGITALIGTATVVLAYQIGKKVASESAGIFAALALAIEPLHVALSHSILPYVPAVFLMLLCLWFVCRIPQNPNRWNYFLAGGFAGLATATQYRMLVLLIPLLIACFYSREKPSRLLGQGTLIASIAFLLGFFVGCPYPLLDWSFYLQNLTAQVGGLQELTTPDWGDWMAAVTGEGIGLVLVMIAGLFWGLYNRKQSALLLLSFCLGYLVLWGGYLKDLPRDLAPVTSLLLILGASFLSHVFVRLDEWPVRRRGVAWIGILGLIIIPSAYAVVDSDLSLAGQAPTQLSAFAWLQRNVPRLNRVAFERFAPDLETFPIVNFSAVLGSEHPLSWYRNAGWNVLILSNQNDSGLSSNQRTQAETFRNELSREGKLLQEWQPSFRHPGPPIQVYSLGPLATTGDVIFQDDFRDTKIPWKTEDGTWLRESGRYVSSGAISPRNLLTNSTFADPDGNHVPDGWTVDPSLVLDSKEGALTFQGQKDNDLLYSPPLPVSGNTYSLTLQIQVHETNLPLNIQYDDYRADGKLLACCNDLDTFLNTTMSKHEYEIKSSRFPPQTAYIRIAFKWYGAGPNAEGTAILKDVFVGRPVVSNLSIADIPEEEAQAWDNYTFQAQVTLRGATDRAGLVFRAKDSSNYYFVEMDAGNQVLRLQKMVNRKGISLGAAAAAIKAGQPYVVLVQGKGTTLSITLNGNMLMNATDSTFAFGSVGFRVGEGSSAEFADVRVVYAP